VILPLGDSPNPRGVPVVTYALLLANVAIYLFVTIPLSVAPVDPSDPQFHAYVRVIERGLHHRVAPHVLLSRTTAYDLFVFKHGFRPAAPHLTALFSSLFLHAGLLHLAGNMLFLWIYGDNVEHRLGRLRYFLAYLGTGVAATLFHSVFDTGTELPLVGASGAISGVLGFYYVWFPYNRVRLLVVLFPFVVDVIMVPARLVLGMFLVIDNLLPFVTTRGTGGGVAYGAHIGGFLVGMASAWLMDRRALSARPAPYRRGRGGDAVVDAASDAIAAAIDAGRFAEAARAYFALDPAATRRRLTPAQSLALADWLRDNGSNEAALAVYRRHLRDYPNGPGAAEAHLGAGLVLLTAFNQPTPAYQHFLEGVELDPSPDTEARLRAALDLIAARQKFPLTRLRGGSGLRPR
jgi:membrane associated rhomboid family serine protease